MKFTVYSLLLFVAIVLASCSTDFEVNAPYQEVKVIYCVLDGSDSIQYVRLGKGFQNRDRDARDIARNEPDSSNFRPEDISAKLFEIRRPGDTALVGDFQPTTITNKDTGIFHFDQQLVYRLPYRPNPAALGFKLEVNSRRTGITSKGVTQMVEQLIFFRPAETADSFVFGLPTQLVEQKSSLGTVGDINNPRTIISLKVNVYATVTENLIQPENGQMTRTVQVKWGNIANNFNEQGIQQFQYEMRLIDFINAFRAQLRVDDANVASRILNPVISFEGVTSTVQLPTYLDVVNNFSAITQSTPVYSNISNSLGVFGCINKKTTSKRLQRINRIDIRDFAPELKFVVR